MDINRENYEAFLLDLWEGSLSKEEEAMLSQFMNENPDLLDDDALSLLDDISITNSNTDFDKSSIRFDQINLKNCEFFFIAYSEGDLTNEEMLLVDKFVIQNPSLELKFNQFNKAKLPIEVISFSNKDKLLFGQAKIISIQTKRWIFGMIAASMAFFIYLNIPFQKPIDRYEMAKYEKLDIEKFDNTDDLVLPKLVTKKEFKNDSNLKKEFSPSSPIQITFQKDAPEKSIPFTDTKKDKPLEVISKLEPKTFSEVTASLVLVKNPKEHLNSSSVEKVKENASTILDITENYLQRKNVITEDRKPDVKGIINSFSNENKKPIIYIEEEPDSKTTVFQFGNLKIQRKTRK
ncbi:hypothetical protein [Brumimicrobium mesophilum]|uniref:hypothetical protein n=1 Tax=Brumimicrobium mesophilum TaxID=392717 RepID=UPI000D140AD2|nr:hypothetical protein [Brumimicrobium mesophilum]